MILLESISGLVAFSVTVDTGSFASAGRKLGLSASAVGKAVDRLEQRLGTKLLTRTTRALGLTAEGELLRGYAERVLADLKDAERAIQTAQTAPRGILKLSVPTVIGRRHLFPILEEFLKAFPDIRLDLDLDDVKVDVVDGGYDVVLRLGELEDSNFHARRIAPHRFRTCASPAYLARKDAPQTPGDLAHHDCIVYRFPTTGRLELWAFRHQAPAVPPKPALVLNDGQSLSVAALAGLGVAQVPEYLVLEDLAAGRLVDVLSDYATPRGDISLVWPPARGNLPRVRAFIDFVSARLARQLSGESLRPGTLACPAAS